MSLRFSLQLNRLPVVAAGWLALALITSAQAAPAVQTYTDQAAPVAAPQSQQYYNSPLAAGTLTLQDVLEAHQPSEQNPTLPSIGGAPAATTTAPVLTPPTQSSSTGLMLSQGMKEVLQKVDNGAVPATPMRAPAAAQGQPADLIPISGPATAPPTSAAASVPANGVVYQPGEEPKNLGAVTPALQASPSAAPADTGMASGAAMPSASPAPAAASSASPSASCDQNVQKWEKNCGEAGYPANYVGHILGETRTDCANGSLHDVWVANTCAPPDALSAQSAKTDGMCGMASNNEYDSAPTDSLCARGVAGQVSGDGPWNWACSGINGGDAAACIAQKRVTPSNGACGSANGVAVDTAPSSGLCSAGTPTMVKGSGPWKWSCKGAGKGNSESCIAPLVATQTSAAPVMSDTAPTVATVASAPTPAATGEKGELCGAAAETLAYQAPDKDLCRVGNAGVVSGDGPWTWSCTDNDGVTSSCRTLSLSGDASAAPSAPQAAPQTPVTPVTSAPAPQLQAQDNGFLHPSEHAAATPACGLAASQPAMMAPTSDLCAAGKAGSVRGSNPWHWTCGRGADKVTCETTKMADASCGVANGAALKSAPFSGLCAAGTPSSIEGNGPWTWTCNGSGGGASVTCAASVDGGSGKIDGACGASDKANVSQPPTDGLCNGGAPSAVSGSGPWTWSCSGSNGGAVATCIANKVTPPKPPGPTVNGLCGFANGVTTSSAPVEGLCGSGDASAVVGNGPWNWSCGGENGGMTVSCTAPLEPPAPIDGMCGQANGIATLVKPQSGLCAAGLTGTVNGNGPWTWTCSGANGGAPASCIAAVAGKTGAMPSTMKTGSVSPQVSQEIDTLDNPPPSGLVTPRLPSSSDSMPSLDRKTIPSLTPSKAFSSAPSPTAIPPAATVTGNAAPVAAPDMPEDMQPLTPPALASTLPSAPVLQEDSAAQASAAIPGNHLTLDPTISTILFTRGSGNIDEGVTTELDRLANVLLANPDVRISLYAYADNGDSTPRDARRLSLTRALAIQTYLAAKGVSASRVDIHAEGANTTEGYPDRVDVKVND